MSSKTLDFPTEKNGKKDGLMLDKWVLCWYHVPINNWEGLYYDTKWKTKRVPCCSE